MYLGRQSDRTQIVPGSFFDHIPPADCLILKSIIHDWDDEHAIKILDELPKGIKEGWNHSSHRTGSGKTIIMQEDFFMICTCR